MATHLQHRIGTKAMVRERDRPSGAWTGVLVVSVRSCKHVETICGRCVDQWHDGYVIAQAPQAPRATGVLAEMTDGARLVRIPVHVDVVTDAPIDTSRLELAQAAAVRHGLPAGIVRDAGHGRLVIDFSAIAP